MNKLIKLIIFFSIFIYLFQINMNLYSYWKEYILNKWKISFVNLTEENKKKLIKNKIIKIIYKKRIERLSNLKLENRRKLIRKKIIRYNLRKREERKKLEEKNIILASASENPVFLDNLYIGDRLKYKSKQKRSLSCELSATSDILSFFENKKITENFVIDLVRKSYYNTLPILFKNKRIWWNPNEWYVWYIDKLPNWKKARQYNMSWYWVLEKPIEKVFNKFNYRTKIITSFNYNSNYNQKNHITEILKSINKWNMVQLWWDYCTNPIYEDTNNKNKCKYLNSERKLEWYYKSKWKLIKYKWLSWEHAFYLLWYKWWVYNPSHIIVWDTITGKHIYNIKEWFRKWNKMQNRSIIIYNKKYWHI